MNSLINSLLIAACILVAGCDLNPGRSRIDNRPDTDTTPAPAPLPDPKIPATDAGVCGKAFLLAFADELDAYANKLESSQPSQELANSKEFGAKLKAARLNTLTPIMAGIQDAPDYKSKPGACRKYAKQMRSAAK